MAQRVKRSYRGQAYTRASRAPGKRTVRVKSYCRRPALTRLANSVSSYAKAKDWGF